LLDRHAYVCCTSVTARAGGLRALNRFYFWCHNLICCSCYQRQAPAAHTHELSLQQPACQVVQYRTQCKTTALKRNRQIRCPFATLASLPAVSIKKLRWQALCPLLRSQLNRRAKLVMRAGYPVVVNLYPAEHSSSHWHELALTLHPTGWLLITLLSTNAGQVGVDTHVPRSATSPTRI
jgi:hypothetical protein